MAASQPAPGWPTRAVALAAAAGLAARAAAVPADEPPPFVPLGVYLSWERIAANAGAAGVDSWTDACRRLDLLQTNHVNLLWVANMSEADLPRLAEECQRRRIRLLPAMSTIEARVDWRWTPGSTYYEKAVPETIAAARGSAAVAGWVLSDEPQLDHLPRLETLRKRFRELDPERFCTAVTMWPQTPAIARQSLLPVVCVDLYPFFGPNDPNGPHTDDASKSFFRRNAAALIEALGERPAAGWVMGMCFSEIWGPRKYDARWHLLGLPGAYLHWRAPTLAEMRWQVWETFRAGARGFICYTLAPEAPDPGTEALAPPDVAWKDVLAREPVDLGPNALTNPDGTATPQLQELGRVYGRLAPHEAILRRWHRSGEPLLEPQGTARAQLFVDPADGQTYAIVLNDDLHEERRCAVRVGETVTGVRDLLTGRNLDLARDFAGGSAAAEIVLGPGDGTILALERQPAGAR